MEQYIAAVDRNKKIDFIFPEHWPATEPFFTVHYPCNCGREVVIVPVTSSRWMARGMKNLSDTNEQHRAYALSNRSNHDHCYPDPHNNFFIDGWWMYDENRQHDESEDDDNKNRDDGEENGDGGDGNEEDDSEPEQCDCDCGEENDNGGDENEEDDSEPEQCDCDCGEENGNGGVENRNAGDENGDQNNKMEYIFPEHWPTEAFFTVYYPCVCRREVIMVPVTLSRYLARGLQDLSDPNEQHRLYALSNRSNQDHSYPEPHNNFFIDGTWRYDNGKRDENEDDGEENRDDGEENGDGGDESEQEEYSQKNSSETEGCDSEAQQCYCDCGEENRDGGHENRNAGNENGDQNNKIPLCDMTKCEKHADHTAKTVDRMPSEKDSLSLERPRCTCPETLPSLPIEYIFPEHWPTEAFFTVYYPCVCRREVIMVPVTLSRYLARGLQDLSDPNEQHRLYALSNRSNQDHSYPEPHNNFFIDGTWRYDNGKRDENGDGGDENEEEKFSQKNPHRVSANHWRLHRKSEDCDSETKHFKRNLHRVSANHWRLQKISEDYNSQPERCNWHCVIDIDM